jgi:hypothetical protein
VPLRYFHFQNGHTSLDHDGVNLPDLAAARAEAVETIATILHEDSVDTLWNGQPLRLWVTEGPGGTGKTLFALRVTSEE